MTDAIDSSVKNLIELEYLNKSWPWFHKIFVENRHIYLYKNYKKDKDLRNLLNVTKPVGGRTETTKYRAPKLSVRLGHAFTSGKDTKEQILWCAYNPRQIWSLSLRNKPGYYNNIYTNIWINCYNTNN